MSRFRLLALLAVLANLPACTTFTSYSQGETQINQWIKEGQYGDALTSLANVDPADPDYLVAAKKRKQVEALAARYEHEVRLKTDRQLAQGKWADALSSYDEALDRLPDSAVLKDGLAQLHRKQANELEQLELKRLFIHANRLKEIMPVYQDMVRVDPRNSSAKNRQEKIQREAESLAEELTQFGNRALANNELKTAGRLLAMAAELSDAPAIKESLKNLKEQRITYARQRRAQQKQQSQVAEHLVEQFNDSFNNKDFDEARKKLAELSRMGLERKQYNELRQQLQRAIETEATRLLREGVNAYSRGQYEVAVKNWKQVLVLQPNNKQAKESLQRAERVLKKLEELRDKQGAQ